MGTTGFEYYTSCVGLIVMATCRLFFQSSIVLLYTNPLQYQWVRHTQNIRRSLFLPVLIYRYNSVRLVPLCHYILTHNEKYSKDDFEKLCKKVRKECYNALKKELREFNKENGTSRSVVYNDDVLDNEARALLEDPEEMIKLLKKRRGL